MLNAISAQSLCPFRSLFFYFSIAIYRRIFSTIAETKTYIQCWMPLRWFLCKWESRQINLPTRMVPVYWICCTFNPENLYKSKWALTDTMNFCKWDTKTTTVTFVAAALLKFFGCCCCCCCCNFTFGVCVYEISYGTI